MKIYSLMKRHFKIYLHNKSNIFISMLSIIVILSLYFLFIRDFTIKAIIDYGFDSSYNSLLVDEIMIFGLLIVINTTSILPLSNLFVRDKELGIIKDLYMAPLSRMTIVFSYQLMAIIISFFLSSFTYLLMWGYLFYTYKISLTLLIMIKSFGVLFLSSILSCNLIFILTFFIKSVISFANFGNLLSVTIGFFTGVYIPIGYYPEVIRNIFFYFPLCQTTSLLRNINTENTLRNIFLLYNEETHYLLKETFGITLSMNGKCFSFSYTIWFLIINLFISFLLIVYLASLKKYCKK